MAPTGHPSFASAAEASASAGTSEAIAVAVPFSVMENTSGQVSAHSPQPISRHFMPHVGRVNKSCHHSHASMRGGGLLTL